MIMIVGLSYSIMEECFLRGTNSVGESKYGLYWVCE